MTTGLDGNDTSGFCDLYELDVDNMVWREVETSGIPPSPCYGHTASYIGDNKIIYFGGKGFQVLNTLNILELGDTKSWKEYTFAGNVLAPRWGHSQTLHGRKIVLYGGKDEKYWSSVVEIDVDKELIEIDPEETSKQASHRDILEEKKTRQIVGELQNQVEDLRYVVSAIGEELSHQKQAKQMLLSRIQASQQSNLALVQQLTDLAEKKKLSSSTL